MRVESSIVTSLGELRAIHEQRLVDDQAARAREHRAHLEATHAAEATRREVESARRRAAHEELLRLEQARVDAERDARLALEAAEADARARHREALDEQRRADERALRRAERARRYPRWMIAATALALAIAGALAWYGVSNARQVDLAAAAARASQARLDDAIARTRAARAQLDALHAKLAASTATLATAMTAARTASAELDCRHAQDLADAAARERADLQRRIEAAQRAHDDEVRRSGLRTDDCLGTALGCLK